MRLRCRDHCKYLPWTCCILTASSGYQHGQFRPQVAIGMHGIQGPSCMTIPCRRVRVKSRDINPSRDAIPGSLPKGREEGINIGVLFVSFFFSLLLPFSYVRLFISYIVFSNSFYIFSFLPHPCLPCMCRSQTSGNSFANGHKMRTTKRLTRPKSPVRAILSPNCPSQPLIRCRATAERPLQTCGQA